MAGYAEKWQINLPQRTSAVRLVIVEAGLEFLALGAAISAIAILGAIPLGWGAISIAAFYYLLVTWVVVTGLIHHAPHRHFGLANAITLCRAVFNAVLLAVAGEQLLGNDLLQDAPFRWGLTIAAATALLLDGADGWAARRSNMTSAFGARFDMETDALFILALAFLLTVSGIVGPWVLASGLTYYLFRLAGWFWPMLSAPLPPSWRRKAICVTQVASLIAAMSPIMPLWGSQLCCVTGLTVLLASFGIDIAWLLRQRRDDNRCVDEALASGLQLQEIASRKIAHEMACAEAPFRAIDREIDRIDQ